MDLEAKKLMLVEEHNTIGQGVQVMSAQMERAKEQMLKIQGQIALIEEMVKEDEEP